MYIVFFHVSIFFMELSETDFFTPFSETQGLDMIQINSGAQYHLFRNFNFISMQINKVYQVFHFANFIMLLYNMLPLLNLNKEFNGITKFPLYIFIFSFHFYIPYAKVFQQPQLQETSPDFSSPNKNTIPFHLISRYSFFPRHPKWRKRRLKYAFNRNVIEEHKRPINSAINTWSSSTPFKFLRVANFIEADIRISFMRGYHGDGHPFGGPGPHFCTSGWEDSL